MSNSIVPSEAANAAAASRVVNNLVVINSNSNDTTTVTTTAADGDGDDDKGDARFSRFVIKSACIFYRSPRSLSFVNLRPIVPGHVLVMPRRCVPLLQDLDDDEHDDLWRTVRHTQRILRDAYPTTSPSSFNVAVQDGPAAGQSVPHVHVHILPRLSEGDFVRNDDVYEALELWAPREQPRRGSEEEDGGESSRPSRRRLEVADDDQRRDRTLEEMEHEADLYRRASVAIMDDEAGPRVSS
jgi:bis(5'-adenosyl)-triphosphatase